MKAVSRVLYDAPLCNMKIHVFQKTIEDIVSEQGTIDPRPQYQRTPVWSEERKKLLIDSILKGYDLPKIYLNKLEGNLLYKFEVADGQQRLRAIWDFCSDKFPLDGSNINGIDLNGLVYSALPEELHEVIKKFELTIAQIEQATKEQVRTLFSRLQMGMGLNQAELRTALLSHIGIYVQSMVENHPFFINCGIPNIRYKHQDYVDHCIAYMHNKFGKDVKGPNIKDVYTQISIEDADNYMKSIFSVLNYMKSINDFKPGIFKNKWGFVDAFILIHNMLPFKTIDASNIAIALNGFESRRKQFNSRPEVLIEGIKPSDADKRLFTYINAFNRGGALKFNLEQRAKVFEQEFTKYFKKED